MSCSSWARLDVVNNTCAICLGGNNKHVHL